MRDNPFDTMDRLFDQMRREMLRGQHSTPAIESTATAGWDAGVSIEETDEGFTVLADLPGFDREELSVRLHDDVLHLDGEHEVGEGGSYRSRRVSEQVRLPAAVDPDSVTASYHNGVLEVTCVVEPDDADAGTEIDIE